MSRKPKSSKKTGPRPQRSENSLFGLPLPRKYRPLLIIGVILATLLATWLGSQSRMKTLQKKFASGRWEPTQAADTGTGTATGASTNPPTGTAPMESNIFEPGSADYYLSEAIILYHQENYAEALEKLLIAKEKAPENEDVYFNMGATLAKLDRITEAEEAYRKALEIFPDYAEAHNNLGRIQLSRNELAPAQAHFEKAIEVAPRNAAARNNYGITLMRRQQPAKAEKEFLQAVELDPDYTEAYVNLGYLYLITELLQETERFEKARESFQNALRVSPGFAPALKGLEALDRAQAPELLARPPE